MSVTAPVFQTLEAALNDLGQAWVLVGDPFTTSGLSVLGLTPGDISVAMNPQFQDRVYPEYSRQPVQSKLVGYAPTVEIPLIWGDPTIYAKVSPTGSSSGGHSSPQNLTYTTMVIVPDQEFQANWSYTGGAWVYPVSGPKHSVWIPKGFFEGAFPTFTSLVRENKNASGSVTFRGVLASASNWPEGTKSYVIGNPVAKSVTGIAI